MVFRLFADLVVVGHLAFILFVAAGGLLVWRWPWLMRLHAPAVAWGIAIITVGFTCPLTPLETELRRRAGEQGYRGGFVNHYIEGVIYPGRLAPLVRVLIAAVIVVGYAGAARKLRRQAAAGMRLSGSQPGGPRSVSAKG
jgi:Protein of Unknown function (DUF2784)